MKASRKFSEEEVKIINKALRREANKESLRNIAAMVEIIAGTLLVVRVANILLPLNKPVGIIVLLVGLIVVSIGALKIIGHRILPKRFAKKEKKKI